jgi:hypothetical protein
VDLIIDYVSVLFQRISIKQIFYFLSSAFYYEKIETDFFILIIIFIFIGAIYRAILGKNIFEVNKFFSIIIIFID